MRFTTWILKGARGGAVGWGSALQVRRPRNYDLGVDSASNRNDRQEYFLRGKGTLWLTTLPPSCVDCLKIWYPQPPGTLRPRPCLQRDCFTLPLLVLQIFLTLCDVIKAVCELLCNKTALWFMYIVLSKINVSTVYKVTSYCIYGSRDWHSCFIFVRYENQILAPRPTLLTADFIPPDKQRHYLLYHKMAESLLLYFSLTTHPSLWFCME
jgi:hypothetical protein